MRENIKNKVIKRVRRGEERLLTKVLGNWVISKICLFKYWLLTVYKLQQSQNFQNNVVLLFTEILNSVPMKLISISL